MGKYQFSYEEKITIIREHGENHLPANVFYRYSSNVTNNSSNF